MQPEYWPQIHGPLQGPALMELHELSPNLAPFCRRTTLLSCADFICHATGCDSIEATDLGVGHASGHICTICAVPVLMKLTAVCTGFAASYLHAGTLIRSCSIMHRPREPAASIYSARAQDSI